MISRTILIIIVVLIPQMIFGQVTVNSYLTGTITDSENSQPLSGASILVQGTNYGASSNQDGYFELPVLQNGDYTLIIRYIGYSPQRISINIPDDLGRHLEIVLSPGIINYDQIVIISSPTGSGVRYQPDRAYSGEELNRRRDITIGQMLDGEPGVSMRSFGAAPARPVIRGMDGERILILENGERMGDLSDSAADHSIALDPQATERLEVIRGPASLLYGTSALGGVINLITSDIPHDWKRRDSGNISLSGATMNTMGSVYGRYGYGWDHSAVSGRFSYRTASDMRTPQGKMRGTDLTNYEGSFGYGFTDNTTLGGTSFMVMQSVYGIPDGSDNPDEKVEIRFKRFANQGRLDFQKDSFFDKYQLKYHVSRFHQQEIAIIKEDGLSTEGLGLEYEQYSFSTTLNIQHKPFAIFDRGVLGFNINGRVLDVGGEEAYTPGDQFINTAFFTFQEIPVTPEFRLQGGVRFDHRSISARTNHAYPDISEHSNDFNVAASVGFNYKPGSFTEIGLQLARAHRYPTSEELFANGAHLGAGAYEIGDSGLLPENGYGVDTFIRLGRGNFQMELAGFVNYIQNFVTFQPTGLIDGASGFPIFQYQAENARLAGGELTLAASLSDNIAMTFGSDYVHGTSLAQTDEPLPFMPPLRFRLGADYTSGKMWSGFTVRFVTKQDRVAPEEDMTDGYTLVSLQTGYRFDWAGLHRIVLRVENLFDITYRDHLSRVEDRQAPMPGRNITIVYGWSF